MWTGFLAQPSLLNEVIPTAFCRCQAKDSAPPTTGRGQRIYFHRRLSSTLTRTLWPALPQTRVYPKCI